jgi:peptidylprolyl isomerase
MKAVSWRAVVLCGALALAGCLGEGASGRKVTKSGVQYIDQQEGTGPAAQIGDLVDLVYIGTLADGKQVAKQEPGAPYRARIGFNMPIPGVDEAVEGMKVGGKRKMWIPSRLGYGTKGSTPSVPPNADLIFDVELVSLMPSKEVTATMEKERTRMAEESRKSLEERKKILQQMETGKDVAENQQKVIPLPSGLKYIDRKIGDGREALAGDVVFVHYTGTVEGKKFDSSLDRDTPFRFRIGAKDVIKGWDEGVVGMRAGGKRKLIIPPDLGYGSTGAGGGKIPPNATLEFEIELLKVL